MARFFLAFVVFFFLTAPIAMLPAGELQEGISLYRASHYEEALEYLARAAQSDPVSSVTAYYTGLAYKQLGDHQKAAQHLKDALAMPSPVYDAYAELIELLYNGGKLEEAKIWISRAEARRADPANISFLKGLVLAGTGETAEAVEAFREAKRLDYELSQAAGMQIALLYAGQRRLRAAHRTLAALLELDPDTEIARIAEDYKSAVEGTLDEHKTWRFSLGLSYQYDTNVVAKPSETVDIQLVDDITDEEDSAWLKALSVNYSPFIDGPWSVNARLNIQATTYHENTDYNIFSPGASVRPSYSFRSGSFSLPASYSHVWLGEDEYMTQVSSAPVLELHIFPGHIGRLSAGYSRRDMRRSALAPEDDRDADIYTGSVSYIYPFADGKGMFNTAYEYRREDTDGRNWNSDGHRISAGITAPVIERLRASLSGNVLFQDYRNTHEYHGIAPYGTGGYPDSRRKRSDTIYRASAGLDYDLSDTLALRLNYSHTRAESNFPIYDYRRNTYRIGMEYRF